MPCHSPVLLQQNPLAERRTRLALVVTLVLMVAEIVGGWLFQSMALLADGWHMSVDALALLLALLAYFSSRHFSGDGRFAFGSWKIEVLAAYTSALLLIGVALLMAGESLLRFFRPASIQYVDAMLVAALGLVANLVCAWLLRGGHHHLDLGADDHGHHHDHGHDHHHDAAPDLNRHAAYVHMLADALTSVLAILALLAGRYAGLAWMDPLMGLVGAAIILFWGVKLVRQCWPALLDAEMDAPLVGRLRAALASHQVKVQDLHVWRVGAEQYACILSLAPGSESSAEDIRKLLGPWPELAHLTLEQAGASHHH